MNKTTKQLLAAGLSAFAFSLTSQAATVANWKVFNGTPTTSGLNTDSPTFGDGTGQDADNTWLAGSFGPYVLGVGDDISVTGSVNFSAGSGGEFGNVRFGLWNDNGNFAITDPDGNGGNNWLGFLHTSGNSLQDKDNNNFVSNNDTNTGATQVNTGTFSNNSTADYDFEITITRATVSTANIFTSFSGGDNSILNTYTVNGYTPTTSTGVTADDRFTFTSFGFLLGGNLNLSQADFSNVTVSGSVVPEPSSTALLGLGGLALMLRRHR